MSRILIWAHSDQTGGIEIACLLWKTLRTLGAPGVEASILVHSKKPVEDFFQAEALKVDPKDIFETLPGLRVGKTEYGEVDGFKTLEIFRNPPFDNLSAYIGDITTQVKSSYPDADLMISCGEPIALKVARDLGIKRIIVTDILLTYTVR